MVFAMSSVPRNDQTENRGSGPDFEEFEGAIQALLHLVDPTHCVHQQQQQQQPQKKE
jgi:hypothetical protein